MQIVFKFNSGFGNRLCNLMNLFYIHEQFPDALLYVNWVVNHHCSIQFSDILNLAEYPFMVTYSQYNPKNISSQVWASSNTNHDTKWDTLQEWKKHTNIVSVSFHLYAFVPKEYCRTLFNALKFTEKIKNCVSVKLEKLGCGNIIHFRGGDLIKLLCENESETKVKSVTQKIENLKSKGVLIHEYNQFTVNRQYEDMLDSISDLIYLSQHNTILGYCPYSHFSSWIFVLSSSFIDNPHLYPVFNYKVIDVVII
jgi:hypothetical protein